MPPAIFMITLDRSGNPDVLITYNAPVTATDFNETNFKTLPNNIAGEVVFATGDDATIDVLFSDDISSEDSIEYSGPNPPALTPQTLAF